jgi:hypothetical protein
MGTPSSIFWAGIGVLFCSSFNRLFQSPAKAGFCQERLFKDLSQNRMKIADTGISALKRRQDIFLPPLVLW